MNPSQIRERVPSGLLSVHLWGRSADESEPGGGAEAEEWNESGSSTETETHGTELFWLDYQADSGAITSFLVHKVNTRQLWSDFIYLLRCFSVLILGVLSVFQGRQARKGCGARRPEQRSGFSDEGCS